MSAFVGLKHGLGRFALAVFRLGDFHLRDLPHFRDFDVVISGDTGDRDQQTTDIDRSQRIMEDDPCR